MAGPLGVLSVFSAAATTEDVEDIDGGPLGVISVFFTAANTEVEDDVDGGPLGVLSVVRQQQPPKM
jgi:hypothetical protein